MVLRTLAACAALTAVFLAAGCSNSPTTPPLVPATFQLQPGDIVFRRAPNGDTSLSLIIGIGNDAGASTLECHVTVDPATNLWPCLLAVTVNTNQDYWVYLMHENGDLHLTDGLQGGAVWIRNQPVSRTFKLMTPPNTLATLQSEWTAGLFRIIDGNGTIQ